MSDREKEKSKLLIEFFASHLPRIAQRQANAHLKKNEMKIEVFYTKFKIKLFCRKYLLRYRTIITLSMHTNWHSNKN